MSDSRLECSFRLFMSHAIKSMTDGFDSSFRGSGHLEWTHTNIWQAVYESLRSP